MTSKTYSVPDVSCGHCKMAIEKAVGALEGVSSVDVSVEGKTVDIDFDEGRVEETSILETLEDTGYPVAE